MRQLPVLFALLASVIPFGIGLTVLGFLWLTPFHEFGSPPLFFRIFGSFVAFGFLLAGASGFYAALAGLDPKNLQHLSKQATELMKHFDQPGPPPPPSSASGYICSQCGAPLEKSADVSPLGDVKCSHCGKWFNIHSA